MGAFQAKDLGVLITSTFHPQTVRRRGEEGYKESRGLISVIFCEDPVMFGPSYLTIVRPRLKYCVQAWTPYPQKNMKCLEMVHMLSAKTSDLKDKNYDERLRKLCIFPLIRHRTRGHLMETFRHKTPELTILKPDRITKNCGSGVQGPRWWLCPSPIEPTARTYC